MPAHELAANKIASRLEVLRKHQGKLADAAKELGISPRTLRHTMQLANDRKISAFVRVSDAGYELPTEPRTPAQAWDSHAQTFERTISEAFTEAFHVVKRPKGPFVVAHFTDEHVDDNASMLRQIELDVAASKRMGAMTAHGGDVLNNWPVAGKLAKQWAEQSCTLPDALLRAQHFIQMLDPDFWTDGNHEEMNPYLVSLLHGWLPKKTRRGYWTVRWVVETPDGRPVRFSMSHKFQKGSSWFHPHHGVIREMLDAEPADVYLEGHLHVSGTMYRYLPERHFAAVAVASAGYKVTDHYAARISRGGVVPRIKGRAHWVVADPQAPLEAQLATVFDEPEQAEAYLNGLQNLRAV